MPVGLYGCEARDFHKNEEWKRFIQAEEWNVLVDEMQEESDAIERLGGEYYTNMQSPHSQTQDNEIQETRNWS